MGSAILFPTCANSLVCCKSSVVSALFHESCIFSFNILRPGKIVKVDNLLCFFCPIKPKHIKQWQYNNFIAVLQEIKCTRCLEKTCGTRSCVSYRPPRYWQSVSIVVPCFSMN